MPPSTQATLRRSERSGGWRARLTIPAENEEKKEVQRILELKDEENSRSEARRRPSLLAVRRRSSAASSSRRTRLNSENSHCSELSFSELSIGGTRRRKKEKRKKTESKSVSPPLAKKPAIGLKWNIANIDAPIRSSKERQEGREQVGGGAHLTLAQLAEYLWTVCPDDREMPGFEGVIGKWERNRHGGLGAQISGACTQFVSRLHFH